MNDIYNNQTYLQNNPGWHEEDAPYKAVYILKLLKRNAIVVQSIGDAGCGTGGILAQLEENLPAVQRFTGFDISADAIQLAKAKETGKTTFEVKDIAGSDSIVLFDLLLVIDVIEHIQDYFSFLKGIVSKSNYTIFHIPLDMCIWSLLREQMLIESKNRVGHIHNFTEDFIKDILAEYGFEVIDQLYTPPKVELLSIKQRVINFTRKVLFFVNPKFCTKTIGGYSILLLTKNHPNA